MGEESIKPAGPWADDLAYRQGVVDLLGILAYGALSAFERLADDGRMAPELADKVHVATMAARQVAHFERVRTHLAGYDVDVMNAMKPFHAAFDAYHSYTKPKDWLEGLLKAYVGTALRPTSTARWQRSWIPRLAAWCTRFSLTPVTLTSWSRRYGPRSVPMPGWLDAWRSGGAAW